MSKSVLYIVGYKARGSVGVSLAIFLLTMSVFVFYVYFSLWLPSAPEQIIGTVDGGLIIKKYPESYRQRVDQNGNIYYEGEVGGNVVSIYIGQSPEASKLSAKYAAKKEARK